MKDFLAYLKMFINPHDDISLLRIANVPARGLSDVTMERLLGASHERKSSVFSAMKNPLVTTTFQANTRKSIEAFVEFVERTRAQLESGQASRRNLQSHFSETGATPVLRYNLGPTNFSTRLATSTNCAARKKIKKMATTASAT